MNKRKNRFSAMWREIFLTSRFLPILLTVLFTIVNVTAQGDSIVGPTVQNEKETVKTTTVEEQPSGSSSIVDSVMRFLGMAPNIADSSSYTFATNTSGTFTDMTGSIQLVAASSDDTASVVTNLPFEFYFMGTRYTQFSASSNGFIRMGGTAVSTTQYTLGTATTPLISALGSDLEVSPTGRVHYKVTGTAPNRVLTVEFLNMTIIYDAALTGVDGTYQVRLYENSGVIEFVYGPMNRNASLGFNSANNPQYIGFSATNTDNNFATVDTNNVVSTTGTPVGNLFTLSAPMASLNSPTDGSRRSYIFTPPVPSAPSGLNFTGVTQTAITLNWTDNSANEDSFAIYRSTDGVNFNFLTQAAENAATFNDTGLSPGVTYSYRVYAVSEGALSSVLAGSQATGAPGNDTCNGVGGVWSNTATWADGTVPTSADNVTIGSGCTVSVDVSTATALNLTINSGGTLQSPLTGAVTTNQLTVGGNVTNNGTLDFSTNGDTSGAILTFGAGTNDVVFGGAGAITDVRAITVAKGARATVVELTTTNFTVQGVNTDSAGFLTITSGTFKISGTSTVTNRVFPVAAYSIPALGGFWLNNPNFTIAGQNGSPTTTGLLRVSQGTLNIGTSTGNSMGFATGSTIIVEGGAINAAGRFGVSAAGNAITYNQSGGTITVCTVGNASTTLGSFDLGTTTASSITISGGTIITQLSATTIDYRNQAGAGIAGVTNGTLQLGNAASGVAKNFNIRGVVPNLVITNTSANHTATFTTVATYNHITLNININTGTTLTLGNQVFLFAGAVLTNNGTLTHTGTSARFITFSTTVAQSLTGNGVVTSPMNSFEFQSDLGFTFDPSITPIVTNRVINFVGNVVNSNKLTVGSGGTSTAIIQIGNTTTPTAAGTFDTQLGFNPGSGGTNISYLRTTLSRVTGGEIPATRTITNLSYDDNDLTHTLTIAGGDLTATGALTLTNGVILTGANSLIHNGAATRTAGYVNGNLSRSYTATGAYTYHVGQNGYSPVLATVTALGTNPSSLTVKPNDATLPGITPATAVSRNWTLTESGDLTTDLAFTYIDPDDVNGNEANYKVFKREAGVTTEVTPSTNNPATNTVTVTGVSSFSDWGIGETIQVLTPPTISDIADQTILEDTNTGAIAFTVGDAETPVGSLTVTGSSSNLTLVPNANIVIGGSGASRTVTVTPVANQSGTATITVTVTDGDTMMATDTFLLTVTGVNDAPTLDAIGNVTIPQDSPLQTVNLSGITAGGGETQVLSVTASSNNTGLIPNPTVTYTSANATGSISFTPVAGQSGVATITVTVTDDGGTANGGINTFSRTFTVTVNPPVAGNVTVNPGNVSYATLKEAIDAINAGTHTGAVTVDVNANTTETAPSVLNSPGAGAASYTSLIIRPSVDGVTVAGPTATGRGLIELNGADNVTIDGDNPNTAGTNRNLTIQNTAANTVTFTSVIRVALNTTTVANADNNIFRNLNIIGSATGRNISTANTTTGTENTTFGIVASLNASGATTAPTALTSVSATVGAGATATNLTVSNNNITTAARGVAALGSATTVFPGLSINNNTIGNPTAGAADQIYNHGVSAQGSANGVISGNTVYVEGFVGSSGNNATVGIAVGVNSTNSTFTIEKNKINRVLNENTQTWAVHGINLGGGNNHIVQNNFVSNLRNNQVAGTSAFSTTFGLFGIRVGAGTGHKVYHNSVNLYGAIAGAVNTNLTTAFGIVATGQTGVDVRNNIFVNTLTGGNPTGSRNVAVFLPTGGTSAMNLTLNNNGYFVGADALNRLAQVGVTFGTGEFTLADFDPTMTTPATNFRSYTSTLSAAGTNDNASLKVDPLFVSNTDLHLQATSPMQNLGANVGVVDDIDGNTRSATPEIGADELAAVAAPGSLQFSNATYSGGEAGSPFTVTVTRTGGSDGTVTVDYATSNGTATGGMSCTAGIDYVTTSGTLTFLNGETSKTFNVTICNDTTDEPDETINYALTNVTGGATLGTPNTAVQTIVDDDAPAANYTVAISDARIVEGNAGTTNAVFNVTLTGVSTLGGTIASVQYTTANGTATAGSDYTTTSGTLNFSSTGTLTISVPVTGDTTIESNEFFFVNLSNPSMNTTITDNQGAGIIVDDDRPYVADFDRDLKADYSVFRPSTLVWYALQSSNATPKIGSAGASNGVAVPGDYDGDGKADFAIFQASTGVWTVLRSSNNALQTTFWGVAGDKPVQGDYDGDGKTDLAVFRPSTGAWWVLRSSDSSSYAVQFGISTDRLVQGDYDGDAKTDLAVYRDGTWYVANSSNNSISIQNWGNSTDKPVSGDFDGDGRNDLAIYRNGAWWIVYSLSNTTGVISFGLATDIPAPADFDGDGSTDVAVFRGSTGEWFVLQSSNMTITGVKWGTTGDVAVPSAYIPQ